jgi:hypothetical protein
MPRNWCIGAAGVESACSTPMNVVSSASWRTVGSDCGLTMAKRSGWVPSYRPAAGQGWGLAVGKGGRAELLHDADQRNLYRLKGRDSPPEFGPWHIVVACSPRKRPQDLEGLRPEMETRSRPCSRSVTPVTRVTRRTAPMTSPKSQSAGEPAHAIPSRVISAGMSRQILGQWNALRRTK